MDTNGVSTRLLGLPQFIIPADIFVESGSVVLEGREAAHLLGPRRLKQGDKVRLADGTGKVAVARIVNVWKNRVGLEVVDYLGQKDDLIPCTIFMAPLRRERFEMAILKLSEIGVSAIRPIITERSIRYNGADLKRRLSRWQTLSFEALKQSRGFKATMIELPVTLEEAVSEVEDSCFKIALFSEKRDGGPSAYFMNEDLFPLVVVVGPEGGFSPSEKDFLTSRGFRAVGLGRRIFRSETAAIYVASLLCEIHQRGPLS